MYSFPSNTALELGFIHWVQYTMQGGSFHILDLWSLWDCHSALTALACYVLLWPAFEKKAFSCQFRLVHKGKHVWSAFQVKESPCTYSVHREHLAVQGLLGTSYRETPRWETGKGWFPKQTCIWAVVHFLSSTYNARRQLKYALSVDFLGLPFCPDFPSWLCSDVPHLRKEGIFLPNQVSPQRRTCLEGHLSAGISLHQPVPRELCRTHWLICPMYRRTQSG